MARHKELAHCSGSNKTPAGKLISTSFLKLPLRFLIALCVLYALCSNLPSANCQPLFSKLAVFLRPRPPRPTTFPSAASHQYNNVVMHHQQDQQHQQQQQHQQFIHQQQQQFAHNNMQFQGFPSNVYPTSAEHLHQLLMQQGSLSQGIPVVSMDPSQNSITIMTPSGPEQIMAPQNPNGASGSGGGVFVAQPIQQNDNKPINIRNNGSAPNLMSTPMGNGHINQNVNFNNNNNHNHLPPSGPGFTFLPNGYTLDGQNLIDGNILAGSGSGYPNFAVGALLPGHYPNEIQHPYHPGLIFHASNTDTNQQMVRAPPPPPPQRPPPPPPYPKNLKGPAIIAVPKPVHPQNPVLIPAPTYLAPLEGNIEHLVNPGSDSLAQQPIIIQSLHQLPNLSPAYSAPHHLLLSAPENAVTKHASIPMAHPIFQSNKTRTRAPQKSEGSHPGKISLLDLAPHFLQEIPQDPEQQKEHQNARLNILKMQHLEQQQQQQQQQQQEPTARPTQIPIPGSEANQNEQNEIDERQSSSEYSITTIVNSPTTTITGSFEYPDPPTPPNMESMNALKYPSPFQDSAEVIVKNMPGLVDSEYGQRTKEKDQQTLHNTLGSHDEKKKKPKTTQGTSSTTAAAASTMYRKVTTPTTRETTTVSRATIEDIMRETHMRAAKDTKSVFRPSPQIHSFEEPVSGVKSYITILPPTSKDEKRLADDESERQRKSLFSLYEGKEAKQPAYEAGFKPVNHYLYAVGQAAIPSASTTSETLYFDLIREVSSKPPATSWSEPDLTAMFNEEAKRELITTADGLAFTTNPNNPGYTTFASSSSTDSFEKSGWKVRDNGLNGADDGKRQLTTVASSDVVEDWRQPDTTADGSRNSIYFGNGKFGPPNCEKFQRFGFCPMNSGYPTDQVEKIASRCSALLSHLIAPLPKADVRYDVIVAKNGSLLKGKSPAPSGWNWKNFSGKPVCDTKEIKIVPGWAKNEQGEWLVILQTKAWKQEAQITLCTPQKTHYSCKGSKSWSNKNCTPIKIKCVQRFTAQRLAVLDPANTDRCPVLRSVFLPSACVCLYDNSSTSSSEELSIAGKKSSGGGKKGKSSKKSSSKSKPSSRTERSEDEPSEAAATSSEENSLNTAADSTSTPLAKASDTHHDDGAWLLPEEEATGTANDQPHAEPMISTHTSTKAAGVEEAEEDELEQSNQNEVEDDNEIGSNSTLSPTTTREEEDETLVTTTLQPELADDSSASEE